jgi:hypothetical protein
MATPFGEGQQPVDDIGHQSQRTDVAVGGATFDLGDEVVDERGIDRDEV